MTAMATRCHGLAMAIGCLLAAAAHAGDVRLTFPLDGHFRAGRFMPVHVVANGVAGSTLTLRARGAIPTEVIAEGGRADAVVPWLAVRDSMAETAWSDSSGNHPLDLPLHPLADGDRLVALAGGSEAEAKTLYPEQNVIAVRLDVAAALLTPTEAWEALDGVVFDAAAAARIDESQLRALLAAGTAVAVRSERRPSGTWPWKREGNLWVVRYTPRGPTGLIEPEAYLPTYGWVRGWPAQFRRQCVLACVIFAILFLAASLWRSRWRVPLVISLTVATSAAFVMWTSRQSPVLRMSGAVFIRGDGIIQEDRWSWYSTLRASDVSHPSAGLTKPVLASIQQIQTSDLRLKRQTSDEAWQFAFRLQPKIALAFVARRLNDSGAFPAGKAVARSPLDAMVDRLYPVGSDDVRVIDDAETLELRVRS